MARIVVTLKHEYIDAMLNETTEKLNFVGSFVSDWKGQLRPQNFLPDISGSKIHETSAHWT
jgi:hypothetical protein